VFCGVGERTREGNDLYHEMQETGVINLEGESKVALVFGQMNEPPGARARVALTGLTVAVSFPAYPKVPRNPPLSGGVAKVHTGLLGYHHMNNISHHIMNTC